MRFQSLILTSLSVLILGFMFLGLTASTQDQAARKRIEYTPTHRVSAHGDEFNDVALSADEQRLFIAAERGEVVVWNISENKIERRLRHEQPVHHVIALRDPRLIVAAGVKHLGENRQGFVRKWNVETEQFVDLPGLGSNFIVTNLAVDQKADVFAASSADGRVIVWRVSDDKVLDAWKLEQVPWALAVVGAKVFVSTIEKKDFDNETPPPTSSLFTLELNPSKHTQPSSGTQVDKFILRLLPSPDGRHLAITSYKDYRQSIEVLDLARSKYSPPLQESAASWIDNSHLLLYDSLDPSRVASISRQGTIATQRKFPRLKIDDGGGRAFGLRGQVASRDGSRSWSVYDHQAWLIEWDLRRHIGTKLISEPGGAFRLSVFPRDGENRLVLTGGADGYVRLWRFSDLALQKEYHVAPAGHFVTEAEFFPDGQRALVGTLPIPGKQASRTDQAKGLTNDYWLLNLATGEKKKWRSFDASNQRPTPVKVIGNDIAYIEQPKLVIASAESGLTQREFAVPGPFRFYSFSQNENWLAILEGGETLHLFDARSTQLIKSQKIQLAQDTSPLEVTNDGRYVYVVSHDCVLLRWDTKTNQLTETVLKSLRDSHDHSDYITLSVNEEFLIVCGSHGDFGIYDTANLDELLYGRSGGTQSYVEAAWLDDRRIILTTDLGLMYAGTLSAKAHGH